MLLGLLSVVTLVTPAAADWTLVGWNNLGMHCMDADYSVFSLLPPYNTIHAQLIDPQGRLVQDPAGVTVTYEAVADPDGSINTTSAGKTNFWDHVLELFGVTPIPDVGLAGKNMPGATNQPQAMTFDTTAGWFIAAGIPITPYDDAQKKNPYPLMRLVARDLNGQVLATTDIVLPVSDEMSCAACHASGTSAAAQPLQGWVNDPDPQRDMRLNILRLHDDRESFRDTYKNALATAGYNASGLYATVTTDGKAILCARCHLSEALPGTGIAGIPPLTQSVHGRMANVIDPTTGLVLDSVENRSACYRCHPGSVTRCLRGAMGAAVKADGTLTMQCQSCHGSMVDVASPDRIGWLDEPACQSCHTGTATHNNGQIRFTSVFETPGQHRVAADQTFATNADTPAAGLSLYRFSKGHGGLLCEACHGSTHAEFPSSHRNDNIQSIAHQGHVGALIECSTCHATQPVTIDGGPHGMHPVGQEWVNRHSDVVGENGDPRQCQACHGADYRGTVLSRAQGDRTLQTESFGTKHFWRGFQVGCYSCHSGPGNGDRNPNRPPVVSDTSASTVSGAPVPVPLSATDADGNALTLRIVAQPGHGTVGLDGTQATYFPDAEFTGSDSFTFAAWDGSTDSNLGRVSVAVSGVAACSGDCNADRIVTVDELIRGVNIALGSLPMDNCPALDANGDGQVAINELLIAVYATLNGCPIGPTATATTNVPPSGTPTAPASVAPSSATPLPTTAVPTATPFATIGSPSATPTGNAIVTLATVQATIFNATCTDQSCHIGPAPAGSLALGAGMSHDQLVGVSSSNLAAQRAGLLRVKAGDPDHSFLITKLTGPSLAEGSPMPLGKQPLTPAQLQLIRDWIAAGALP
jgi:hypothetical protein